MEKFEIGQVVKIANKEVASDWAIEEYVGDIFTVDRLAGYDDNNQACAVYEAWYVPPAACELVKQADNFVEVPEENNNLLSVEFAANFLRDVCFNASYNAGWWYEDGQDLRQNKFVAPTKLMLIVSEIAEAMEGDRKDAMDDKLPHRKAVEVELADAVIRIMDFCGAYNLDIGGAIAEKMAVNLVRKDHKPEERKKSGGKKY